MQDSRKKLHSCLTCKSESVEDIRANLKFCNDLTRLQIYPIDLGLKKVTQFMAPAIRPSKVLLRGGACVELTRESPGPKGPDSHENKNMQNCDSHTDNMVKENNEVIKNTILSEKVIPGPEAPASRMLPQSKLGRKNRRNIEGLSNAQHLKRESKLEGQRRRKKQRRLNKRFRYDQKRYKGALEKIKDNEVTFTVNNVNGNNKGQKMFVQQEKITFMGEINDSEINFEIDTGSSASILSLEALMKCEPQFQTKYEKLPLTVSLTGVNGGALNIVGLYRIPILLPIIGETKINFFIVTNNGNNNLIGLDFMVEHNMKIRFSQDKYVLSFGSSNKMLQLQNKKEVLLKDQVATVNLKIKKRNISPGLYEAFINPSNDSDMGIYMPPTIVRLRKGGNKIKLAIGAKQNTKTVIPGYSMEFCFKKIDNNFDIVPWHKLKWSDLKKDISLPKAVKGHDIVDGFKLYFDIFNLNSEKEEIKEFKDPEAKPDICLNCVKIRMNMIKGKTVPVCRLHVSNPNITNLSMEEDKDFLSAENEGSASNFKPGELTVPEYRTNEEINKLVEEKLKALPLAARDILRPVLIENEAHSQNSWDVPHIKEKFHFELKQPIHKNTKIYPTKKSDMSTLYATLQFLIWYNLIERAPLDQQFGAPLFLIPRKEVPGKSARPCRIVLDMRHANESLSSCKSAAMSSCWDQIRNIAGNSTYVSSLDLTNMYYSCRVSDEVLETGFQNFVTVFGVFRYLCCISGASNSPVFANCKLQEKLHTDTDNKPAFLNYTSSFYDDVNLATDSSIDVIEHCHMLVTLIRRIHATGFMISLEKSSLAVNLETESLNILGLEVSKSKIKCTEKRKLDIINCLTTPNSVKDLQGLIGLVNYCRNLLSANDLKYLTILSSKLKKSSLLWDQEGENCLQKLRESLLNNDMAINLPAKNSIPFLFTDANKENISAIMFYVPITEFDKPVNITQSFDVPASLKKHFDEYDIIASVITEPEKDILSFCHTVYYSYIESINPSLEAVIKLLSNTLFVNSSVLRSLVQYDDEEEVKTAFKDMLKLLYNMEIDTQRFPFTEHALLHSLSCLLDRQIIIFFHLTGYSNSKPYVKLGNASENAPICISFSGQEYRLIALMTKFERVLPFSNFEINNIKGPELIKLFRDLAKKNTPQFAGCFSRKLPESWRDTPIFAKELLALSSGLQYFESYLNVSKAFAVVDSSTVAQGLKNVKQKNLASKLARISIALSNNYPHLSIVQTPSSQNPADYLSRIENNQSLDIHENQVLPINQFIEETIKIKECDLYHEKETETAIKVNMISTEIVQDQFQMLNKEAIINLTMMEHSELYQDKKFTNIEGVLFRDKRRFIPTSVIPYLVLKTHIELGHVGQEKILDYLNEYFCFVDQKTIKNNVTQILNACYLCGLSKTTFYKPFLYESKYDYKAFECIQIDCMETQKFFNKSKKFPVHSILGIVDLATKYLSIHYLPSGGTNEICTALMSYLSAHPTPRKIHCDNASVLRSDKVKYLCKIFGIDLVLSSPYRSRARAFIENKFLEYREFSRRFHALYPNLPYEISYAFCTRVLNTRKIKNVPASPAFLAHYQGNKLVYNNDFKSSVVDQFKGKLYLIEENGLRQEELDISKVYEESMTILRTIEAKKKERNAKGRVESLIKVDDIVLRRNYGKTGKHRPAYIDPCVVTIKKGALLILCSLITGLVHLRHHMDVKKLGQITENILPKKIMKQYKLHDDQLIESIKREGEKKDINKRETRGDKKKHTELERELRDIESPESSGGEEEKNVTFER